MRPSPTKNLPTPPTGALPPGNVRMASRGSIGRATVSPPSSSGASGGGSFSVADHHQDVDQVISQVTKMLQRRLVQHEASFEHVLQQRSSSSSSQPPQLVDGEEIRPASPPRAMGNERKMPGTAHPPTTQVFAFRASPTTSPAATTTTTAPSPEPREAPQPTSGAFGNGAAATTPSLIHVPHNSGVRAETTAFDGESNPIVSHPLGTSTVVTASGESVGAIAAVGGSALLQQSQSFSRPVSPSTHDRQREPSVELRSPTSGATAVIRRRSTKHLIGIGSRSPSLNMSPTGGVDPNHAVSTSPSQHALLRSGSDGFSALSGSSLPNHSVTLVASGMTSPTASTSTSGPAIRPSPTLMGMVFPSGNALVQHLNECGPLELPPAAAAVGAAVSPVAGGDPMPPPSAVPIAPQSSRPSVVSPSTSVASGKMSQTEKWKHRVSHIEGPVQLGSKETVFSVRSEIQSLHKKYPSDARLLRSTMDANKKDLVQVFAIVNNKQYQTDTEEVKGQLRRTDAQIDAELAQHAKMMDLLDGAVTMLDQASSAQQAAAPGVGDVDLLSTEALRVRMEQTADPAAKKQLALKLFIRMSQEKVKHERAVAQQSAKIKAATSAAVDIDPRDELLQRAKQLAASVGLNLEAEAKTLPPVLLDPASLAAVDEALMTDAAAAATPASTVVVSSTTTAMSGASAAVTPGSDHATASGDDPASTSSIASLVNMKALARRMSSFRRANPVLVIEQSSGNAASNITDRAPPPLNALGASYPPAAPASSEVEHSSPSHLLSRPKVSTDRSVSPAASSIRRVSSSLAPSASMSKSLTLRAGAAAPQAKSGGLAVPSAAAPGSSDGGINSESVVYTSAQRTEAAAALAVAAATLRMQARTAREVAEGDYALRLQREADQAQRLKSRSMDQILRDAIDNRAPSPIEHITKEDLDRVLEQARDAEELADKMLALQKQTEDSVQLREELLGKAKFPLMAELRELEDRVMKNTAALHQAHLNRKNLVKQYWQWRQRVELGDVKAGKTFEEELERGPRFRHVGVQNVIQTEYLSQQVEWLRQLLRREQTFRRHVLRVESLVNELREVNLLVDTSLRCPVCQGIFKDPVTLWPCGHSFCQACFETLSVSTYLHRCPVCFSVGSEGCLPNLLLSEIVAKWAVKEAGYSNVTDSLAEVKDHMELFQRDKMQLRLNALEYRARQIRDTGYLTQ